MLKASAITHEFTRVDILGGGSCLYTAFRHVSGILDTMNNVRLKSLVADRIRTSKNLQSCVLQSGKSVKENSLWDAEAEIRALVVIGRIRISIISKTKSDQGKININILKYGEDIESFKECVYILYDDENKHYEPLVLINKTNPDDTKTIFECDDPIIALLLDRFIRQKLQGDDSQQPDCPESFYETERSRTTSVVDETGDIYSMITPTARGVFRRAYENLMSTPTHVIDTPLSVSNASYVSEKPAETAKLDDEMNAEPTAVEEHLQTGITAFHEMRLKSDPVGKFRGRTPGDFIKTKPAKNRDKRSKRKTALKRKNKPSKPRSPRYITDGNTRQYLHLLIPKELLSTGSRRYCLEIHIVTGEIDGYTYIHPYFEFKNPMALQFNTINPILIPIDPETDLELCEVKQHYQMKLKLVLVMRTNRELMQAVQPLKVFSTSTNNYSNTPMAMVYDTHGAFKDAYRLHDLRFAITLCQVNQGNEICHRYYDKIYFSSVLTEDKKAKVRTN